MVYVGDDPKRDVVGAKNAGLGAVWIENTQRTLPTEGPKPDRIVSPLAGLLAAEAEINEGGETGNCAPLLGVQHRHSEDS